MTEAQTANKRLRVAVLQGGQSAEHAVSLMSAANVMRALDPSRFEVILVTLPRSGLTSADFFFTQQCDVVFPVVHGSLCEDGTLQGLLEQAGLPYVGSGVLASAIGMDKDVAKRLVRAAGMPVAPFVTLRKMCFERSRAETLAQVSKTLGYPIFVKPVNAGSSIGISKAASPAALGEALDQAFCHDVRVIAETCLDARELEVAVLGTPDDGVPFASVVGEICPHPRHGFYSHAAKYHDPDGATLHVPARLDEQTAESVQAMAQQVFVALECEGLARVDFFLERSGGQLWFNEVNTLPGFTDISMYPRLIEASGISCSALLTRLIELALARHACRLSAGRQASGSLHA